MKEEKLKVGERRKREIRESAKKIFLKKGFRNTVMDEIMKDTGLSRGGLYHHYGSMHDILYDIMLEGSKYRETKVKVSVEDSGNILTPKILAKVFLEKMLVDNEYVSLYVMFLCEMKEDDKLKELFQKLKDDSIKYFKNYMIELGYEPLKNSVYDFLTDLINSILLGCEILESRENFIKNKDDILTMLECYFEKIQN